MTEVTTHDLSAAVIDEQSEHYNFATGAYDDWRIVSELHDEERPHQWEPMMNILWPLPDGFEVPGNAEVCLHNMTIVEIHTGQSVPSSGLYLALTGGGMDMSWSIARTYVDLGLLPPATLGRLPDMADKNYDSETTQFVIDALVQSHQWMVDRHERDIDELERLGE